jgi:cytidylate kinase
MMHKVIAVDGPSASGKSTVSRRVAASLGAFYVDSGALYRAVTFLALEGGAGVADEAVVLAMMGRVQVETGLRDGVVFMRFDGLEFGKELRTAQVNETVSLIAAMAGVRKQVVFWLRAMSDRGPLVMEGRDIGTVVFPDTPYKFYLDASPEERARRRHAELQTGMGDVQHVAASLQRRDGLDQTRQTAPLKIAADAVRIDSTAVDIDEVVRKIVADVRARGF